MMYLLDKELDEEIANCERTLLRMNELSVLIRITSLHANPERMEKRIQTILYLLKELKERRAIMREPVPCHGPKVWQQTHNGIISVECKCGEVTKHKVPLNSIIDFKCPKDR